MSDHFDFALACILRPDTPRDVLDKLADMTKAEDWYANSPSDQLPLSDYDAAYKMASWGAQPGFPGVFGSALLNAYQGGTSGKRAYRYTFCFRSVMNDDAFWDEWLTLVELLAPYSETEGWVGWYREEYDLHPTLVYFRGGKVYISDITQTPISIIDGTAW